MACKVRAPSACALAKSLGAVGALRDSAPFFPPVHAQPADAARGVPGSGLGDEAESGRAESPARITAAARCGGGGNGSNSRLFRLGVRLVGQG